MKIAAAVTLTALILAGAAVPSRADTPSPSNLTLKAGVSFESSDAKPFGFSVGGEYTIHPASTLEPFNAALYVDVLGKSTGGGFSIRNGGNSYIGGGAGYYSTSVTPPVGCAASIPPVGGGCNAQTYTSSGFGGKLFAGIGVAPGTSLEIGYHFLPSAGGYQTNTVTAQLAVHF